MGEALHDVPLYREFTGLDNWMTLLPDESALLRFRHLLESTLAAQFLASINEDRGQDEFDLRPTSDAGGIARRRWVCSSVGPNAQSVGR